MFNLYSHLCFCAWWKVKFLTFLRWRYWARLHPQGSLVPPNDPESEPFGCPKHRVCYKGCGHRSCPWHGCKGPPPLAALRSPACSLVWRASLGLWVSVLWSQNWDLSWSYLFKVCDETCTGCEKITTHFKLPLIMTSIIIHNY